MERLIQQLQQDYPDLRFKVGKKYAFRPPRTIMVGQEEPNSEMLVLHELGHALCKHQSYKTDIDRVRMECEAWEKAKELATNYHIMFDDDAIQDELDTYRDWLHKKSRCRICGLTRFQTTDGQYHCPICENLT